MVSTAPVLLERQSGIFRLLKKERAGGKRFEVYVTQFCFIVHIRVAARTRAANLPPLLKFAVGKCHRIFLSLLHYKFEERNERFVEGKITARMRA